MNFPVKGALLLTGISALALSSPAQVPSSYTGMVRYAEYTGGTGKKIGPTIGYSGSSSGYGGGTSGHTSGGYDGKTSGGHTSGGYDGKTSGGHTSGGYDGKTSGGHTSGGYDGKTSGGHTSGGYDGKTSGGHTSGGYDGKTSGGHTSGGYDGKTSGGHTSGGYDGKTNGGHTNGYTNGHSTDYGPSTTYGPSTDHGSPSTTYGPSTSYGPSTDYGPSTTYGPSTNNVGPSTTYGPSTNDVGPSTTYGPSTNDVGPSTDFGPSTNDVGPSTNDVGPSTNSSGPGNTDERQATSSSASTDVIQDTSSSASSASSTTEGSSSSSSASSSTGEESSSSSTGESTSTTGFKEEEKNQLRHKLKPLFHLRFDYGTYIVNLTPQFKAPVPSSDTLVKYASTASSQRDALVYGDYSNGFQKTVYGSIEVGLGIQMRWWYANATGIRNDFWAYVGVLPIVGKDTESTRYVRTLDRAYDLGGRWKVPDTAESLDKWDAGDSITYVGHGGIIFSGGIGFGPIGVGAAKLAQGSWETYVEKVGGDKAYVKITRGKLSSLSAFTNIAIINLSKNDFKYSDDGFSFLYDLTTDTGRKAYEDMIRGNVAASEMFASQKPANFVELAPVTKVETFRTVSTGHIVSKSMSIPILWDKSYSEGRVQSFTTSDLYVDRNTAKVHYGIYQDSEDSRFWTTHKEKDFMFYGARYSVENWDTKERMESMFGTYSYAFRHESSDGKKLRDGIRALIQRTGQSNLMVDVPGHNLGYTGIEFNVNFSDENTAHMMQVAQNMSESEFIRRGTSQFSNYFGRRSDPYKLCNDFIDGVTNRHCEYVVRKDTARNMSRMYSALRKMYKTMNSDPKAFAAAYGKFGEGMAENLFTFRAAMAIAGSGVTIDYLIEGTKISMYNRSWITGPDGEWYPSVEGSMYKGLPFEPQTRHSRVRGVIIGNSPASKVPLMNPVQF